MALLEIYGASPFIMTVVWLLDIHGHAGPEHLAITDAISEAVMDGSLPPGAELPKESKLAYDLGVAEDTVKMAYNEARRRGLVERNLGEINRVRGGGAEISAVGAVLRSDKSWQGAGDHTVVTVVLCSAEPTLGAALVGRSYPSQQAFDLTPKGRRFGEWW
mgnify:CR=1 FL=1